MPYCSYCGKEISAQAVACPSCGHPNEARAGGVAGGVPVLVGTYAGFWRRFAGWLIDAILIGIVSSPFTANIRAGDASGATYYFNFGSGIVGFLYAWLMIAFVRGQTLGKMALGIRITRPDGSPADLGHAAARAGMAIVSALAIGLGYLWAAWDREHRTWHDMVAETRAYRVR